MKLTAGIIVLLTLVLQAPLAGAGSIVVMRSANDVNETINRLETVLRAKGVTIFARIDHAANARGVNVSLRPVQLLIFGNPKLGSPLLASNPMVGLDLPMKALAWEDADGKVWLGYTAPATIAERYRIEDRAAVIDKMTGALKNFAAAATRP
jgi:uncharacterized protein (DUF302 family)